MATETDNKQETWQAKAEQARVELGIAEDRSGDPREKLVKCAGRVIELERHLGDQCSAGEAMATRLLESPDAKDHLLANDWLAARKLCRVCGGPLEGAPGPECDETGCPDRDGSTADPES